MSKAKVVQHKKKGVHAKPESLVMHGMVIAGTHSGCGKTTVTLGLLSAFQKKGLKVQTFKAGPDFIDAGLHGMVTGLPPRNLDIWLCGEQGVRQCFLKHASNADVAVVEGVMGMYDGYYSTAMLADILDLPVILVIDAYGMAESAGAVVKGFSDYGEGHTIAGIIFNRVSSEAHFTMLQRSIKGSRVFGYLPKDTSVEISERHLGLITAQENPLQQQAIDKLGELVLEHIDVEGIMNKSVLGARLRRCHPEGVKQLKNPKGVDSSSSAQNDNSWITSKARIALAYDRAFCFYYEDNLDALRDAGAEIIKFSPLQDKQVPDADALYIGGGYPELYARVLSKNRSMLESIEAFVHADKPVYAECGGMMYLSKGIHDFNNRLYDMVGVLPFETKMEKKRLHLGYREIILQQNCILGMKGARLRGHEFHYSERINVKPDISLKTYYAVDSNARAEGYAVNNVLASYIHVHFCSNTEIARHFIDFSQNRR